MNYNTLVFWVLFAAVFLPYWHLSHRRQNALLLVTSYLFYGFWDYRFLFLILCSTVIDFIGGLGVAGVRLPRRRLLGVGLLLVGSALALCSGIDYGELVRALVRGDGAAALAALPRRFADFSIALGTAGACLGYGLLLPRLYAAPEDRRRRWFLTISMVANLAFLGFFKYCDFFVDSFHSVLQTVGVSVPLPILGVILPAGISFYTFQAMSYTIDIYRGHARPTESLADFALFVCFFPHLVAGPIMRAHTLLPQVVQPRRLTPQDAREGVLLVLLGLFKKLVVADNMAPIANAVFTAFASGHGDSVTGPEVIVGVYAFAIQIYGDFSGYSSIARGISKLLGFDLVINFHLPYLATSPSDFWRRWHISLSTWLRDYLYVPLGGNRRGERRTYGNLMTTMLLGGLWHGASWTFVAWGFYHGALLALFRAFKIPDRPAGQAARVARIVLMFHLTCLGWLLFRADSFTTVVLMLQAIVVRPHLTPFVFATLAFIAFHYGLMFVLEWWSDGEHRLDRLLQAQWLPRAVVYAYLLLMLVLFRALESSEFIYFQF